MFQQSELLRKGLVVILLISSTSTAFLAPRGILGKNPIRQAAFTSPDLEPQRPELNVVEAEAAREKLRLQLQEAEARRMQLEMDILDNAVDVENGKKTLNPAFRTEISALKNSKHFGMRTSRALGKH
jgi:hypothetical protein